MPFTMTQMFIRNFFGKLFSTLLLMPSMPGAFRLFKARMWLSISSGVAIRGVDCGKRKFDTDSSTSR